MTSQPYQRKPNVYTQEMDGQVFLADPDTNVLFHLDPIGSAVWRLLEHPTSTEEVINLLTEAFPDAEPEQITTDVATLFEQMSGKGLITESGN